MKKTILFISLILLLGCDEEEITITSYQIINNFEKKENTISGYDDGTIYELIVYCFNDSNEVVRKENLPDIPPGESSEVIWATPETAKIKISRKQVPDDVVLFTDSQQLRELLQMRLYSSTYFDIIPNRCKTIKLNDGSPRWRTEL